MTLRSSSKYSSVEGYLKSKVEVQTASGLPRVYREVTTNSQSLHKKAMRQTYGFSHRAFPNESGFACGEPTLLFSLGIGRESRSGPLMADANLFRKLR